MTDKNTFYNMLKSNAESQPDAVAVVYDTMKVTYAKLFDDVTKKALHFQKFEGKRIAIFGPASYRWIVNMFGTIVAGKELALVDFFLPHDSRVDLLKKTEVNYTLTSTTSIFSLMRILLSYQVRRRIMLTDLYMMRIRRRAILSCLRLQLMNVISRLFCLLIIFLMRLWR